MGGWLGVRELDCSGERGSETKEAKSGGEEVSKDVTTRMMTNFIP